MRNFVNFDTKGFNKAVGEILATARRRSNLSLIESCNEMDFRPSELKSVEEGSRSLPGYILYQFFKKYDFTEQEMMFFCCTEETKNKFTRH